MQMVEALPSYTMVPSDLAASSDGDPTDVIDQGMGRDPASSMFLFEIRFIVHGQIVAEDLLLARARDIWQPADAVAL
jgi:hypothetical protein